MFHRLVGGAVLAEADRVVRPHVRDGQPHHRGEPHRGPHVVGEDQEGAAVRTGSAVQGDAVEDRSHGVLADPEVQRTAVAVAGEGAGRQLLGDEGGLAPHGGVVALRQVGGAAPQFGQYRGEGVQDLARCLAGGDGLARLEDRERLLPARRQLARRDPVERGGAPGGTRTPVPLALVPLRPVRAGPLAHLTGVCEHLLGHLEAQPGVQTHRGLGGRGLLGAQRGAVDLAAVLLAGRGPADDGPQGDEGRPAGLLAGRTQRGVQRGHVLHVGTGRGPVDLLHVPAVRPVARHHVLGLGDLGVVLDGDVVVVVEDDQVAQLLVTGQGTGLVADALLQVAVGGDDPDRVVEGALTGSGLRVEQAALTAGGHGHAHGVAQALAERTGGGLHARGVPVLGVRGGEAAGRPQRLDVVELQAVAGQVELVVQGQTGVAAGQHEAVATRPPRVGGVVPQQPLEEQVRGRGQAHGGARVAVAGLFDGVDGQRTGDVHGTPVQLAPCEASGRTLRWGPHGSAQGSLTDVRNGWERPLPRPPCNDRSGSGQDAGSTSSGAPDCVTSPAARRSRASPGQRRTAVGTVTRPAGAPVPGPGRTVPEGSTPPPRSPRRRTGCAARARVR